MTDISGNPIVILNDSNEPEQLTLVTQAKRWFDNQNDLKPSSGTVGAGAVGNNTPQTVISGADKISSYEDFQSWKDSQK